ncbi:hypothetical protein BGZ60DRAFT_430550 [Tricladium varicosporioides]|nr:hypothetical protein BGZ60DRAFT_430550 [Hymenoscyphus varicosporioides]
MSTPKAVDNLATISDPTRSTSSEDNSQPVVTTPINIAQQTAPVECMTIKVGDFREENTAGTNLGIKTGHPIAIGQGCNKITTKNTLNITLPDIEALLASEKQKALEEKKACLRSLSFPNIDARQQNISHAHPETCNWFFETTQFQQWRNLSDLSSHNGVLWIKGKPGAGKSTLMKHTLDYCRKIFKDHIIASYFFNARGSTLEKTPLGMLRSLLYQLLEQNPVLSERFIPMFRDKRKKHETWEWREGELTDFLLSEIKTCQSKPLLLLIDALDECNEPEVRKVVSFLESLSINAKTSLNICLSSRHYPNVHMKKTLELIVEKKKEHDKDISIYVRDKLTERDEEIEKGILDKASGIFMWVVLVVELLNQAYDDGEVRAMQKKLHEVPSDLDEVFWTLLDKGNQKKQATLLILQWVLFARRLLKPEELYFAVLSGTQREELGA